jgi:hypothetical protein
MGFAQTTTNKWSKRVVHKTTHPLASFLNVHIGPTEVLIVDHKRFENVRGNTEFYIQVPNTNSIVFVTDDIDYNPTYHIFNMDTDVDMAFPSQHTMSEFGKNLGWANPYDSVSMGDDGIFVLSSFDKAHFGKLSSGVNFYSTKELIYLDPKKKAVMADKIFYYDETGKMIYEDDGTPPF